MPENEKRWTLFVVLVVLLVAVAVFWVYQSLGAALCEGQRPGYCERQQDDAVIWGLITGGLLVVTIWAGVRAWTASRDASKAGRPS